VTGRKRGSHCSPEERVGLRDGLERARPPDERLDRRREEIGDPDAPGGQRRRRDDRPPAPDREQRRDGDPEETGVPCHGQDDEQRIEPVDAMLDDPDERAAVEARGR
jgi:hypothetical protein